MAAPRLLPAGCTAGDGGPDGIRQPSGPPSRLGELKHERDKLRKQLSRLQEARRELEEPSRQLLEIEAEEQALGLETAAALAAWAQGGCHDRRPVPNAAAASSLARRREAATAAASANSVAIGEIDQQVADTRARLRAAEGEISAEAAVLLVSGVDAEMAALEAAIDDANGRIATLMGLHAFLHRNGGAGFPELAWRLSQRLRTPELGASKQEISAATEAWRRQFEELTA
jgi:predicted  nucleic acid-binding Zn-ribbon protein